MMTQKEKLVELLKNNVYLQPSSIANYLIDNGVVILPCKANGVLSAAERIKQYTPTVDAAEVVRCCDT